MPIDIERLLRDNPISIDAESVEDVHQRVFGGSGKRIAPAHYEIHEELGRGRYGHVHRATDTRWPREVALKLVSFSGSRQLTRLEREAHALARLNHPNVVTVFEKGIADIGSYFLATELVRGTRLDAWMAVPGRRLVEILEIFAQAAEGLEHAHQRGLVHRDFKPNNAIVDDGGRLRILDFGLAKVLESASLDDDPSAPVSRPSSAEAHPADATVSEHGRAPTGDSFGDVALARDRIVGTPDYASPEQLEGKDVDPRSDQFSLCVALFEACYGFRPFSGRTSFERCEQIREQRFMAGRPQHRVPWWLVRLLRRGLSPDPSDRFESIGRIAAILRARIERRVPTWAALVAGVTLALGTATLVSALTPPEIDVTWEGAWTPEDADRLGQRFGPGLVPRLEAYEQQWLDAKDRFPGIPGAREAEREANACMAAGRRRFAELVDGLLPDDPGAEGPPVLALTDGRLEALWLTRLFDPEACLEATPRWEQDQALVDGLRLAQRQRLEGRPRDAITTLSPLLERTTTSGAAEGFVRYELGIAKTHAGDLHAIQDLRESIRHHGHDTGFYAAALARLVEARVVLEPEASQGLDEALDDLERLEGSEPRFEPVRERARGHALLRLGRFDEARDAFEAARKGFEALPVTGYHQFMIASCVLDRAYAESNLPEPHVELDPLVPALATIGTTLGTAHPSYVQHATQVARLMGDEQRPERGHEILAPVIAALHGSEAPLRLVILARAEQLRLDMESSSSPGTEPWDQWLTEADTLEHLLDGHRETPDPWSERAIFHVREILFSASATFVEEQPSSAKALENAVAAIYRIEPLTRDARPLGRVADVCGYLEQLDGSTEGSTPVLSPTIKSALPARPLEILAQSWTLCR